MDNSSAGQAFAGPLIPTCLLSDRENVPLIDPKAMHGVAFLFRTRDEAEKRVKLGGSGFLIGKQIAGSEKIAGRRLYVPYIVSNRHVVWEGSACVASINRVDGGSPDIWEIDQSDWIPHPTGEDVAVAFVWGLYDKAIHKLTHIQDWRFVTPAMIDEYEIGVGEEVFMVGRFVNHQGRTVNEPAARFGCISMMPSPIWNSALKRDQESFAVEMKSRTGFSGSPVAAYRTVATVLTDVPPGKSNFYSLLGVNWGYIKDEDGENTWLNAVVPAWKILEVLETPALKAKHQAVEAKFREVHSGRESGAATPAFAGESDPPSPDENPNHLKDFKRLVDVAARKRPQGGQT